jgi:hypothetical protein
MDLITIASGFETVRCKGCYYKYHGEYVDCNVCHHRVKVNETLSAWTTIIENGEHRFNISCSDHSRYGKRVTRITPGMVYEEWPTIDTARVTTG